MSLIQQISNYVSFSLLRQTPQIKNSDREFRQGKVYLGSQLQRLYGPWLIGSITMDLWEVQRHGRAEQ